MAASLPGPCLSEGGRKPISALKMFAHRPLNQGLLITFSTTNNERLLFPLRSHLSSVALAKEDRTGRERVRVR